MREYSLPNLKNLFGKQFETINNRLDSVDKGLGSLGNQIASLENMQKAQPQGFMPQQQQQSYLSLIHI